MTDPSCVELPKPGRINGTVEDVLQRLQAVSSLRLGSEIGDKRSHPDGLDGHHP